MDILFLIIGLAVGAALGWFIGKSSSADSSAERQERDEKEREIEKEFVRKDRFEDLQKNLQKTENELDEKQDEFVTLNRDIALWQERHNGLQEKLDSQKEEVDKLQEKFKNDFKVLAQEILDKNSQKFTDHNKSQIDTILNPFKEKLESFEKKVDDNFEKGQLERTSLKTEVKMLADLNKTIEKEAHNLTKALKGDVKVQGNWGEVILERILEKSGLQKDREYFVQNTISSEDGKIFRPDVIVHLPDEKKVIIDAKVSLVAYEKFSSADDLSEQKVHLKEHINSIKAHVKGLSDKNYQNLYGIDGLDFVLLFIPIEGAFSAALQTDNSLFNEAFDKNVILVSTSTLLATLKTIASIWKQEYQNQNAVEIARQGGALYDKFVNFSEDLISLGKQMNTARGSYENAMNKLVEGKGNLVSRAEKMQNLGLKVSKKMNAKLLDRASQDGE